MYASDEDRAAQARTYTQYTKWAQAVCNVSELELRHYLETAAALPRSQRGVDQIPKALRGKDLTVRHLAVLRCRVECLRGYASVDVAKCVARAQQDLQLTDVTTVQDGEFVTRAAEQLEHTMALTSLEGREFVANADVELARIKEMSKVHVGHKQYFELSLIHI